MNDRDAELLSAYLDEELGSVEARQCRERLLSEPELRRELDALSAGDELLKSYAASIDRHPLPDSINGLVPLAGSMLAGSGLVKLAMAAALVLGLGLVGYEAARSPASLDSTLAGQRFVDAGGSVEIVATFRTQDGRICRELVESTSRSVVCRQGNNWNVVLSTPHAADEPGIFVPAGSEDVQTIDQYVRGHIQGDVLDPEEEQRLIENNWQDLP